MKFYFLLQFIDRFLEKRLEQNHIWNLTAIRPIWLKMVLDDAHAKAIHTTSTSLEFVDFARNRIDENILWFLRIDLTGEKRCETYEESFAIFIVQARESQEKKKIVFWNWIWRFTHYSLIPPAPAPQSDKA